MILKNEQELKELIKVFKQNTMYNEKLIDAVLEQLNFDVEDWENLEHNFRKASDGWHGFIYYDETTKFFDENQTLIFDALRDYENEVGTIQKPEFHDNEMTYKNWMSWFACEAIIFDLIDFKYDIEQQYEDLDETLTNRKEQNETLEEAKYILNKKNNNR